MYSTIILHCRANCIEAVTRKGTRYKGIGRFTTKAGAIAFLKKHEGSTIMCSSDMDFPEENTKNKRILKLVKSIRP